MNLTKAQWKVIKPLLPKERTGRPPRCRHAVFNALWYMAVTGVQWRHLPREYPPWQTVYYHFRHLLCDTQGLALELVVTPANVSDSQGARLVFRKTGRRRNVTKKLRRVWVDAGYKKGAVEWCQEKRGVTLEVVTKDKEQSGFVLQKRRWVVERTFSWLSAHRRLVRDYEGCIAHSEALIWIALSRILLKRLA